MLEQLFNLIQNESQQEIIQNPAIPNEHNNHAVGLATDSIFGGLQNALSSGGLQDVLGMFTGKNQVSSDNPLVGGMINNFVKSMIAKFGIDSPMATNIASSLIPGILGKLVHRTNDPNDSGFDINSIIGALTGNSPQQGGGVQLPGLQENSGGIDFGSILKKMTGGGLDADQDGSIGFDDLASMVSKAAGGAQQQGAAGSGGGIMDILKGFMK